ncbi:Mak31p SCDLUD_003520 [Saccharomycodes ludwigii]|uniref:Mak31p n=1 Tax=Saccharomycodes ludwigii TaxID=36035 RepID=UPI001E8C9ADC|nr:hypothetical protein SCDLUD_003520 [Saccharomycodes ludwigii]KAH3900533.1 hypothetical protein SCDLUD_003520 [Saccharomycodes ludwigii]
MTNGLDKLDYFIGSALYIKVKKPHESSNVTTDNITNLKNNRSIKGILVASDCDLNLLLDQVVEYNESNSIERELGLVSVPRETIKSIHILKSDMNTLMSSNYKK